MSVPEVRLTDDERRWLHDALSYLPFRRVEAAIEAVESIVAARLAGQAEQVTAAVEAYNPCHGGEELNADHIRYCVPFHEWQAAALRGDSDG